MSVLGGPPEVSGPSSTGEVDIESRSPLRLLGVNRRLRGAMSANAELTLGACIVGGILLAGLLAGVLAPDDPVKQEIVNRLAPPGTSGHLLGTDSIGRDTLSRLMYGARNDLLLASAAVLLSFLIGSAIGVTSGYRGGWLDSLLVGVIDVIIAFPLLVLLIALVFVLGPGVLTILIAITVIDWVVYARIARASTRRESAMEYVLAAQVGGVPTGRVLRRHILPNLVSQLIVYAMSDMVLVILFITVLGYLGLGIPPPAPDWGTMISEAQPYINNEWWLAVIPGVAIMVTGLGLSLIADGLAEKLDAR
jgi:peptide/nickel transport system permease protein